MGRIRHGRADLVPTVGEAERFGIRGAEHRLVAFPLDSSLARFEEAGEVLLNRRDAMPAMGPA